jgi:hypothetical protein
MTHITTAATLANNDTFGGSDLNVLYLDPDIAALFAEVDAILCAALDPALCPPAPPVTGCPPMRSRSTGRSRGALARRRTRPMQPVWAVQRSPPTRTTRDHDEQTPTRGR